MSSRLTIKSKGDKWHKDTNLWLFNIEPVLNTYSTKAIELRSLGFDIQKNYFDHRTTYKKIDVYGLVAFDFDTTGYEAQ